MNSLILLSAVLAVVSGQFFYHPQQNYVFTHPVATPYSSFIQQPNVVQPGVQSVYQFAPKFRFVAENEFKPVVKSVGIDTPVLGTPVANAPVAAVAPSFEVPVQVGPAFAAPVAVRAPANAFHSFHSQDDGGAYEYGYYGGPSSKHEVRDHFGNVHGAFNYIDAYGNVQSQKYVADEGGFRVAATNLPEAPVAPAVAPLVPVKDTFEVQQARAEFQRTFDAAVAKTPTSHRSKRSADPAFAYSSTYSNSPFYNTFTPSIYKSFPGFRSAGTFPASTFDTNTFPVQPLRATYAAPTTFPGTHFVQPMAYSATGAVPQTFFRYPSFFNPVAYPSGQTATVNKVVHNPGFSESYTVTH